MRVLVLEAVTAGLCQPFETPSLLAEGAAMWQAVVRDLAATPGVTVSTCLSIRARKSLKLPKGVKCLRLGNSIDSPESTDWTVLWEDACASADKILVIAPEIRGLLAQLAPTSEALARKSLNCTAAAIELTSDKWKLAAHCVARDIPTIPTWLEDWTAPPDDRQVGWILKPRDGAGGWLSRRIPKSDDWYLAQREFRKELGDIDGRFIRQPVMIGRWISIAGLFTEGYATEWLPVAAQRFDAAGSLEYTGGTIPARLSPDEYTAILKLAQQAAGTISGLRGYVGFDVLLPQDSPQPLLVEINPRVCTSYIGYRRSCQSSLMARWLTLAAGNRSLPPREPLRWLEDRPIVFSATGDVE